MSTERSDGMRVDSVIHATSCKDDGSAPQQTSSSSQPTAQQIADAIIAHVRRNLGPLKSFAN